jgi:hypothetical protein
MHCRICICCKGSDIVFELNRHTEALSARVDSLDYDQLYVAYSNRQKLIENNKKTMGVNTAYMNIRCIARTIVSFIK